MKTDVVVRRLVDELRPVRPLRPVPRRLAQWSIVVLAVLGVELGVAIARDIGFSGVTRPALLAQATLPLGVALVAAAAALQQSIPGRADASLPTVSLVLFLLWVGVLATAVAVGPPPSFAVWTAAPAARCAAHVAASGMPGGVALLWLVRAGATLNGVQTGILIALAAAASGALATQLTCPNPSAGHLLLWHAGSVLAIALTGIKMRRLLTAWSLPARKSSARAR
jgi:hypothetical protein